MQKKSERQLFPIAYHSGMPLPLPLSDPASKPFDVVTLGLNSVDLVAVSAAFPVPNSKQRLDRFVRLPGGQMATAAAACARLGWRARYIGSFGGDELGRLGRESLTHEGVDISASWTVEGATNQFAVVLVDASNGDRTVLWDRHRDLAITADRVPADAVTSGRLLLVDCHETAGATAAARCARQAGIPTIVDVERVRPGIHDLLAQIDVIIAAEEFPMALTGDSNPERAIAAIAKASGAAAVVVTLGGDGSLTWCAERVFRTRAFPVSCVDTTGAGDAFRAGFASGWLRNPQASVEAIVDYANAVAALNCRGLGARGGLPTPAEVDALLAMR